MQNLNKWVENEYNPWKKAMLEFNDKGHDVKSIVQRNAAELKYIIALLLEKREAQAVKIWNELELNPVLQTLELNTPKDELVMVQATGEKETLSISVLLDELQAMLDV
tara:strand:- start:160956 stop:161279 length:324 start_codon:yes stop_codon:yes gene_type:complete